MGRYFESWQRHELSRQWSLSAAIPDDLRLPAFSPQIPQMRLRQKHNAADLGMSRRTHQPPVAVRLSLFRYGLFASLRDLYLGVDRAENRFE